jgi:hypothetical protein
MLPLSCVPPAGAAAAVPHRAGGRAGPAGVGGGGKVWGARLRADSQRLPGHRQLGRRQRLPHRGPGHGRPPAVPRLAGCVAAGWLPGCRCCCSSSCLHCPQSSPTTHTQHTAPAALCQPCMRPCPGHPNCPPRINSHTHPTPHPRQSTARARRGLRGGGAPWRCLGASWACRPWAWPSS